MNPEFDEKFRQLLKSTPNMMVNSRGMAEFVCLVCRPNITFPDIDQHMDHVSEVHNTAVSYKKLLMQMVGQEQSNRMGLPNKTEKEVIALIRRYDAWTARRNRNG